MESIDQYYGKVNFVEYHITVGRIEDGYNMALVLHDAIQRLHKLELIVDSKPWNNTEFLICRWKRWTPYLTDLKELCIVCKNKTNVAQ